MSGYLDALVARDVERDDSRRGPRPAMRSASPIADLDQRIGVVGLEAFELGESSFADVNSTTTPDLGNALQASISPNIAIANDAGGEEIVQRKEVSPSGAPAASTSPSAPHSTGTGAKIVAGIQPTRRTGRQNDAPLQSVAWKEASYLERFAPSIGGAGENSRGDTTTPLAMPLTEAYQTRQQALPAVDDVLLSSHEEGIANIDRVRPQKDPAGAGAPSASSSQTHNALLQFAPSTVPGTFIHEAERIDTTHLEPLAPSEPEHGDPVSVDTDVRVTDVDRSPRVVINRVNDDVTQQAFERPATETSRRGPLTAESISVIGPLSRGVRPRLRFSLRHR